MTGISSALSPVQLSLKHHTELRFWCRNSDPNELSCLGHDRDRHRSVGTSLTYCFASMKMEPAHAKLNDLSQTAVSVMASSYFASQVLLGRGSTKKPNGGFVMNLVLWALDESWSH